MRTHPPTLPSRYRSRQTPAPLPRGKTRRAPARRPTRTPLAWGGTGFVVGAVFWQAIGFGTLVSDAVLYADPAAGARLLAADAQASTLEVGPELALQAFLLVDPASCTALVLDRAASETAAAACPTHGLALQLDRDGTRDDLDILPVARGSAGLQD